MNKYYRLLRFSLPLYFVLLFTNWLPDTVLFLRMRGFLASFFFRKCGKNLRLGRNITFYNSSNIKLGNDIYIALGCWFLGAEEIKIDDEVMFGPYCVVVDSNHTILDCSYRYGLPSNGKISVGFGSWIGAHSTILPNLKIGKGVLVAANSVVNRDIDNYQIVGGVPAKSIK